jgi:alpha-galactosidase
VIDYVVGDLGAGYLKLDYNINGGPGTDIGGVSAGAGLLAHNRAHLDWLDGVLDRHPGLTIENCGSGGLRADYAMLSRLQLQSTSDQQDFLRYAAVAAAAPAAIAPEQAAAWAYPQPDFSDEEIAFTMCSALLGRVHLSGYIDRMSEPQRQLVADAVGVYRRIRTDLATAVPFWPLSLPGWADSWLALGMRTPSAAYLAVWHRDDDLAEAVLPVRHMRGRRAVPEILYPQAGRATAGWSAGPGELSVALPSAPSACLIRLA